jgi:hypothetical protein
MKPAMVATAATAANASSASFDFPNSLTSLLCSQFDVIISFADSIIYKLD